MSAPKQSHDPWLTKTEAAKLLGVAVRQLERRSRNGYIESRRLPREVNETTARVVYSRADILALKAGKPNVHAREVPATELASGNGDVNMSITPLHSANGGGEAKANGSADARTLGLLTAFAETMTRQIAPPQLTMPGPFVNLAEAVAISGMPASWLLARARAGVPWAVNVGTGKREFWRFSIGAGKAR